MNNFSPNNLRKLQYAVAVSCSDIYHFSLALNARCQNICINNIRYISKISFLHTIAHNCKCLACLFLSQKSGYDGGIRPPVPSLSVYIKKLKAYSIKTQKNCKF